jgi:hypothetical protein
MGGWGWFWPGLYSTCSAIDRYWGISEIERVFDLGKSGSCLIIANFKGKRKIWSRYIGRIKCMQKKFENVGEANKGT